MKKMTRILSSVAAGALLFTFAVSAAGCAGSSSKGKVLRVYNWEDYICEEDDEEYGYVDLISAFEKEYEEQTGTPVTVEYSTFGTNENMYNELKINAAGYDLVCPSDYMIMKMIKEDMVEPFSEEFLTEGDYAKYASPYIKEIFETNTATVNGEEKPWADYAVAYMWGTMGYVYNPELVDKEDLSSWAGIWSKKYGNMSTIKDSVRDSYFLGVAYVYGDELTALAQEYKNGTIDEKTYNAKITEIMNRTAWSGDAVYAMDDAEPIYDEETGALIAKGIYLNYAIPEECSNIWFDGWVMPKGANTELAEAFINFLSRPENAVANMNYIGYTSAIAGDAVYEEMLDWYSEGEEGDLDEEGNPLVKYDLNYFFAGVEGGTYDDYSIWVSEESLDRQIFAQYPTEEVISRSAIMQNFSNEETAAINEMWEEVKGLPIPVWAYVVIAVIAGVIVVAALSYVYKGKRTAGKPKKGYKLLKRGA